MQTMAHNNMIGPFLKRLIILISVPISRVQNPIENQMVITEHGKSTYSYACNKNIFLQTIKSTLNLLQRVILAKVIEELQGKIIVNIITPQYR